MRSADNCIRESLSAGEASSQSWRPQLREAITLDETKVRALIIDDYAAAGQDEDRVALVHAAQGWEPPAWRAQWVEPMPAWSEEGGT